MPDGTAREVRRQCVGLLEQRPDQIAPDFVLPVELFDEHLAVAKDGDLVGPQISGGLQRFDQGGILGHVVRRFAQEKSSGLQRPAGGVFENETRSGRARIAPAAAIGTCDHLHRQVCSSEQQVDLVSRRGAPGLSRAASRLRTGHSPRCAEL